MNKRISTKRSVGQVLLGVAALLGVWAAAAPLRTEPPHEENAVMARGAVQQAPVCQRADRFDGECRVLRLSTAASRLPGIHQALISEQIQHDARSA